MGKYVIVFLFLIPSLSFSQQTLPGFNDRYVTMEDGVRLYVTKVGQGEPVTVLHGGWGATYNYLINPLNPFFDRYHFIFYNQRGSHKSVAPDSTVSLQQFVEDLENIRQEIGANNVTLLSHGIGSNLAYAYLKIILIM